ncbi:MAG: hypothetical protein CFE44_28060, partial [Burkholderiales bacterium PBB4]
MNEGSSPAVAQPTSRYPLPYAFARTQQLLLENHNGELTLWLHGLDTGPQAGGVSEVLRKYAVQNFATEPLEQLRQRISAAYAQ